MRKYLVYVALLVLSVISGSLLQSITSIVQLCYHKHKLEKSLFQRSENVVKKYDSVRHRSLFKPLKLSTNTYNDDILVVENENENVPDRENATLLMLVRNFELPGALKSMRSLEDRFNKDYHYDWVFLNDVPFSMEFITRQRCSLWQFKVVSKHVPF